ncbi:FMN-dependent NADH-azoreductase [Inhella gelatinilytica]|uniref:FMN dependent NADH:quinone oxidoreductase n=1 Tax=Inhella gelatinilytica TaxID=2795030 RepID=A0A931NFK0_9BURK|nr:NAD(P)H-dependent oxidoreductase [Inhella gelatinilytica]MBH9554315.1 NAD(P)H-dependent oxidoreductase [Inhella gelatinilytica]
MILQINTSARSAHESLSTRLATEWVSRLRAERPEVALEVLELGQQAPAVLDEAALQAMFMPAEQRSPAQAARVAQDIAYIDQVRRADTLVLAVPMINFGVPAALKNWIDAIAKAGVTFRYTAQGPEGLLPGKTVYVVLTRGGIHRDQPQDSMVPYLRTVLGFLGMTEVHFIYAEGLNMGPEAQAAGLANARAEMDALVPVHA